jgi:hypothetical protein
MSRRTASAAEADATAALELHFDHVRAELTRTRAAYFRTLLLAGLSGDPAAAVDPPVLRMADVEAAWLAIGYLPAGPADMPVPFDGGYGHRTGYVVGDDLHAVAVSEWVAGFRVCERCFRRTTTTTTTTTEQEVTS